MHTLQLFNYTVTLFGDYYTLLKYLKQLEKLSNVQSFLKKK